MPRQETWIPVVLVATGLVVVLALWRARRNHRWPFQLRLVDLIVEVDAEETRKAKEAADDHPTEVYPQLRYTEGHYEWALLYRHIQFGQIEPDVLRKMRRVDLEYMAGHPAMHPELLDPPPPLPLSEGDDVSGETETRAAAWRAEQRGRGMKIIENVARASRELERRTQWRVAMFTTSIAAAAGLLGAYLGYLATR